MENTLDDVKALGESKEDASLEPASLKPVSLKLRGKYKVKTASDESECDITGACLLPDASVMLTDWENNSLKQLDSSYKVIRSLDLGAAPYDVCYTNSDNEVAVTLKKKVQFVSVGDSLKKTRSFLVGDNCCWGITCSNEELFVCCGDYSVSTTQTVRVFNLAGQPLRTIELCDPQGQPLLSNIRMITTSSCGNKLYVTDNDKGVITIDRSGNLQQQFHDEDLSGALGICTLDNGDLFVGGLESGTILHVSRNGGKLAVVLGEQDGLDSPRALVFDKLSSGLIVTTEDCDKIKVYDVE